VATEDDFHRLLDAEPDNFDARGIFADWLEQCGDWRAAGYRWMWEKEKVPQHFVFNGVDDWNWRADNYYLDGQGKVYTAGVGEFFLMLTGFYDERHAWRAWLTRREAEEALCRVIHEQQLAAVA